MRNHWSSIALVLAVMAWVALGAGWIPVKIPENWLAALWSQTMAAWVQAIGSIGAIAAAIAVSRRQASESRALVREQSQQRRLERLEPVRALIEGAAELVADAQSDFGWLEEDWDPSLFSEIEAELSRVSLVELGDFELTKGLMNFRRAFASFRHTLGVLHGRYIEDMGRTGPPVDDEDIEWFDKFQAEVAGVHAAFGLRLRQLAQVGYPTKAAAVVPG